MPAEPVGSGQQALKSLTPYIFRVARRHQRLLHLEDGHVTFQSKDAKTDPRTTPILPGAAVIRRVWPHVRPPRCIHGRDSGFRSARHRHRLAPRNDLRNVKPVATPPPPHAPAARPDSQQAERRCPKWGSSMRLVGAIEPTRLRLHGARASP